MPRGIRVPDWVEDETAYVNAAIRRIKANARKSRFAKWQAMPDVAAVEKFISAGAARGSKFFADMEKAIDELGGLSDKQLAAVRASMARADAKKQELRARDAGSAHVGTVGKRVSVRAVVSFVTSYENAYGTTFVTGLRDEAGNVFIYKGRQLGVYEPRTPGGPGFWRPAERGLVATFSAGVKAHVERDGVKQTILQRITKLTLSTADGGPAPEGNCEPLDPGAAR